MGNVTLRTRSSGGFKLRRNLKPEWRTEVFESKENVFGSSGELNRAILFGDPNAVGIQSTSIVVAGVEFTNFKTIDKRMLQSSAGVTYKPTDGPFFTSPYGSANPEIYALTTLGAWLQNAPTDIGLVIKLDNLESDGVYEIRLIFSNEEEASNKLVITPNDYEIDTSNSIAQIVVGKFIAPKEASEFTIKSADGKPPFINAMILRKIGFAPRLTMQVTSQPIKLI